MSTQPPDDDKLVNIDYVADWLHTSPASLRSNYRKLGIPYTGLLGHPRFRVGDVRRWLGEQEGVSLLSSRPRQAVELPRIPATRRPGRDTAVCVVCKIRFSAQRPQSAKYCSMACHSKMGRTLRRRKAERASVTAVHRTENLARNRARNDASRTVAHNHGQRWTGPELEIAARKDLTVPAAAQLLGRTLAATSSARYRTHHDLDWNIRTYGRI